MPPRKKAAEPQQQIVKFKFDGDAFEIDPESITWGEAEDIETGFGVPLDEIEDGSARNTMALLFVAIKRQRPAFTIDELRAMPIVKSTEDVESRPTESAADTDGSPS